MPLAFPMAEMLRLSPVLRNVSFRYPGSDGFVLRDVSFKIEKGQLCVSPINILSFGLRYMPDSLELGYRWD